jgi:beta-glucanase (GH16 family)
MPGNFALVDLDTPKDAYTKASYMNPGDKWDLVFSDEFNLDGRTFYPGDDPFWEAVCIVVSCHSELPQSNQNENKSQIFITGKL